MSARVEGRVWYGREINTPPSSGARHGRLTHTGDTAFVSSSTASSSVVSHRGAYENSSRADVVYVSSSYRPPLALRYGGANRDRFVPMREPLWSAMQPPEASTRSGTRSTGEAALTTRPSRHVDAAAAEVRSSPTRHTRRAQQHTRTAPTPEKRRASRAKRTETRRYDSEDSYSYSYSDAYSYSSSRSRSGSSSSTSSVISFVGSRFDKIPPSLRMDVSRTATGADTSAAAGLRHVSFASHRTELCASRSGTVMTANMVAATPTSLSGTQFASHGSSVKDNDEMSATATPTSPGPIGGHGGSHLPTPAAIWAALRRGRQREPSGKRDEREVSGRDGEATATKARSEVGEGMGTHTAAEDGDPPRDTPASKRLTSPSTTPTTAPPHSNTGRLTSASTSRTSATAAGAASATSTSATNAAKAKATLSNASRALAVYDADDQSAAALLRAPPGSVVSAIHTVNLEEEARRRRSLKAMRESVDDALADQLDDADDEQLLPYPSQLTHRVLPPPPPPAPTSAGSASAGRPGGISGGGDGTGRHNSGAGQTRTSSEKIPAGFCVAQRRARRRQAKADVRDATRQAVNECLLRSHHVPLVPFETHRNQFDWMASAAPTYTEAVQSRWAHGLLATSENPKALMAAMGDRQRPARLSAKTTFAYGRRAGGGPQGGGRSEFLGPNDPVLYWASQLREQACLRLEPIDTTEVYSYTAKPGTHEAADARRPKSTVRRRGSGGSTSTSHKEEAMLSSHLESFRLGGSDASAKSDIKEDDAHTDDDVDDASLEDEEDHTRDRLAVAAAMAAARKSSSPTPALIALTAEGSTTVHATSPAQFSARSHELEPVMTPAGDVLRSPPNRRTSLSTRGVEGRGVGRGLTALSPPRSALARI